MERAVDAASFFAAPHGRYLVADGLAYWCESASLWGVTMWGALDAACVDQLTAWIDEEHRRPHPPYATVVDLRRVRAVDADAIERWQRWYVATRHRQRQRLTRAAVVRPDGGLPAAVVAGIPMLLGPLVPWTLAVTFTEALAWLDVPSPETVAPALDGIFEAARAPRVLDALRATLDRDLRAVSLDAAATTLGVSVRTLQRQLQAAGTSYDVEVQRARVRLAQRLLAEGDAKLGAVALEAGFATQAHFNAVFRRVTGATPGAWRKRARGA